MTEIRILNNKNTIEITKSFEKKASIFGTEEYRNLQEVRRDYPNFAIKIKSDSRKGKFKGLTIERMREYIIKHEENAEIRDRKLNDFNTLTGKDDIGKELGIESASYGEVKKWFLDNYPEINSYFEERKLIIKKAHDENNNGAQNESVAQ